MTKPSLYVLCLTLLMSCTTQKKSVAPFTAPSNTYKDMDPFIQGLIDKMTIDEKLGQLSLFTTDWESTGPTIREGYQNDIRSGRCGALFNSHTAAFTTKLQKIAVEESRLKIPLLFGYDVIHGYKTMMPIPLAEACSWDLGRIERSAYVMSKEAAAAGLHWTFAPMVDISREPRWGRVMEGAGEDTYLGSRIATARVRGIQGDGSWTTDRQLACVKHFAAYGAPTAGRDYATVDMSERVLREVYLPPYKAAVDAGARTVMTSFNEYDGVPASANAFLLQNILRQEWGFNGFVVSDYTSINEMVNHGVAANDTDAGILSINAGLDMDLQGGIYQDKLKVGLKDGRVSMSTIDRSVAHILKIKKEIGLFDNPYKYSDEAREKATVFSQEHRDFSRDIAARSIVLLKNETQTLPLAKNVKNILVVGPLGDDRVNQIGAWSASGDGINCASLMDGLQVAYRNSDVSITFFKGCDIESMDSTAFAQAYKLASQADLIIAAVGEHKDMSGEAAARAMISVPGVQTALVKRLAASGKPLVSIVYSGRPLVLTDIDKYSDAVIQAWWLGTMAGHALTDVLTGKVNPSGRLAISFPRHEGQIPIYYSQKNTGRPYDPNSKWNSKYTDMPNTPLYPFGYGLSYTTFNYGKVSAQKMGDKLSIQCPVTNSGAIDGETVIQLYVRDKVARVTRPVKELKGFEKTMIRSGETKTITFNLTLDELSYLDIDMSSVKPDGEIDIFVGTDSATDNKTTINLDLKP
jgi:beta-glucosidase